MHFFGFFIGMLVQDAHSGSQMRVGEPVRQKRLKGSPNPRKRPDGANRLPAERLSICLGALRIALADGRPAAGDAIRRTGDYLAKPPLGIAQPQFLTD